MLDNAEGGGDGGRSNRAAATEAARQPQQQQPQQRAASSSSRAAEDVRPVQAELAERKHKRRRCRSQGGASRTSSACAPTTRHPRRRKTDGQRPCSQRARSKRACTQGQGQGSRSRQRRKGGVSRPRSSSACPYRAQTQEGARRSKGGVCATSVTASRSAALRRRAGRPRTASRSAALRRRAGRPIAASRSAPEFGR